MTPAQHSAYLAICQADPECIRPIVTSPTSPALNDMADAAITDHLHTRIQSLLARGYSVTSCCMDGGGWWEVVSPNHNDPILEWCTPSKLSAYLAAHIIRLGLPRELIDGMEGA